MPEVETYKFEHKELVEALIKASNIHEGKWMLVVNFGFTAGNIGPNDDHISPGAIVQLNHVSITRAKDDSPKALVVDAADVNPPPSTASRQPSSRSRRAAPKKAS